VLMTMENSFNLMDKKSLGKNGDIFQLATDILYFIYFIKEIITEMKHKKLVLNRYLIISYYNCLN